MRHDITIKEHVCNSYKGFYQWEIFNAEGIILYRSSQTSISGKPPESKWEMMLSVI